MIFRGDRISRSEIDDSIFPALCPCQNGVAESIQVTQGPNLVLKPLDLSLNIGQSLARPYLASGTIFPLNWCRLRITLQNRMTRPALQVGNERTMASRPLSRLKPLT